MRCRRSSPSSSVKPLTQGPRCYSASSNRTFRRRIALQQDSMYSSFRVVVSYSSPSYCIATALLLASICDKGHCMRSRYHNQVFVMSQVGVQESEYIHFRWIQNGRRCSLVTTNASISCFSHCLSESMAGPPMFTSNPFRFELMGHCVDCGKHAGMGS